MKRDGAQYQYIGSVLDTHASAPTCNFRLPPAAAAAHFRVPPLHCSFPSLLHPLYHLVKEPCDAWVLRFVQPPSPAARAFLLDCLLPRLVCRNIPTAFSLPRLIQVTKMISWLIIADDEDDFPDGLGADVSAMSRKAALVMAILRAQNPTLLARSELGIKLGEENHMSLKSLENTRALEALAQLWEEMCITLPPILRTRFISTMADYFDAIKVQASYRKAHRLPNMDAYLELRRQASFILPALSLVEYALGIELDEDMYANPQLQTLRSKVVDYICLCNDILSCRIEIGVGDYFNMPSIVYSTTCPSKEDCETFQDALAFVARMTKDLDAQLVSMVASINQSSLPSLQYTYLKTYIIALGSCMSGSLAWFLETARYRKP